MSSFGPENEGCTCRINFNGTGSISISDSFNASSITDDGTGNYRVTTAVTHANAHMCVVGSIIGDSSTANRGTACMGSSGAASGSTTVAAISCSAWSAGANLDFTDVCVAFFGDL